VEGLAKRLSRDLMVFDDASQTFVASSRRL